jgi:hypothetical protein
MGLAGHHVERDEVITADALRFGSELEPPHADDARHGEVFRALLDAPP